MFPREIRDCPLFAGIGEKELEGLLTCLSATRRLYKKDSFIFAAHDKATHVGIVLRGGVYIVQEDFWGGRAIFAGIKSGGLFGEAFSCVEAQDMPVGVVAAENSEVMLIDYRKIVTSCTSACVFHAQLIRNMLHILAQKNIMLTQKMEHLSKRTTREKLMSYLSSQAMRTKSGVVEVPFNRQDLADYLCVDRSALSRELGLMRKEGLLRYEKNRFELLRGGDA